MPFDGARLTKGKSEALKMDSSKNSDELPVIDLPRLQEVTEGDHAFEEELFTQFQKDMERNLEALEAEIHKGSGETLIRLAHNIKGTSANVGILRLSAAALALEVAARADDAASCASAYQNVVAEYQKFLEARDAMKRTR